MASIRRRHDGGDGDDTGVEAKRRRGAPLTEVEKKLEDIICGVGNKTGSSSLESNLDGLCGVLLADLDKYRTRIIDLIAKCVVNLPTQATIYSTVVGLLNAKNFNFGGEMVERLMLDLQDCMDANNYSHSLYLITFLMDLGNSRVLTWGSVVEFLESLVQNAFEEDVPQVRTDWFIYALLRSLPYVGAELQDKRSEEFENILEGCGKYIESRKKVYLKCLQVWSAPKPHEQEEYLDCLWAQINSLRELSWKEKHIQRPYLAFDAALQDALQHNLPSFAPPIHRDNSRYPLPRVVFRMFDYADCPEDGPVLPGVHSIERFLIEDELTTLLDHDSLDRKRCANSLLEYAKDLNVPAAYMILEVIFGHLFRLPTPPHPTLFYGSLMLELCKAQPNAVPPVLAQAAEMFYLRSESMQPICIDRFVDWFSFHLSNFQFRWSWNDMNDCLELDDHHPKFIFAREVLEKCMRLLFYDKLVSLVPAEFSRILPSRPEIRYTLDDEATPGHEHAATFTGMMRERASDDLILKELQEGDNEDEFSATKFAVFFATLLNMASRSISHNFAALIKYTKAVKTVADSSDDMQHVLLRTLYECWKTNHQMILILVDKLLKMQIIDCSVVVSWIFSDEMKQELNRQWIWEMLNTALERLSRHIHNVENDVKQLKRLVDSKQRKRSTDDDDGADRMEDDDPQRDLENLAAQEEKLQSVRDFQKNLFLDVLHKFTVILTEFIVNSETEGTDFRTAVFSWVTGRFKQIFLQHYGELLAFASELHSELFSSATIDPNVLESYQQFVALRS